MVEYINGLSVITATITSAIDSARSEVLIAQPGGGVPPAKVNVTLSRDLALLARGATLRTIYQHSARHDLPTVAYAEQVAAAGGGIRTTDEFFDALVIVDRRRAFIAANADHTSAVILTDPATLAFLVRLFDITWQRADNFLAHSANAVSTPVRDRIIRLLREGETGALIARRLGISKRGVSHRPGGERGPGDAGVGSGRC
jgi:hypothetical protein